MCALTKGFLCIPFFLISAWFRIVPLDVALTIGWNAHEDFCSKEMFLVEGLVFVCTKPVSNYSCHGYGEITDSNYTNKPNAKPIFAQLALINHLKLNIFFPFLFFNRLKTAFSNFGNLHVCSNQQSATITVIMIVEFSIFNSPIQSIQRTLCTSN